MAVFPLHCGPLSPGPRGLTGKFEALPSQIKANSHPLLALQASTLSYRSWRPQRTLVWSVMVVVF